MSQPNIVEGGLVVPPGSSVAIVASRFTVASPNPALAPVTSAILPWSS